MTFVKRTSVASNQNSEGLVNSFVYVHWQSILQLEGITGTARAASNQPPHSITTTPSPAVETLIDPFPDPAPISSPYVNHWI